MNPTYPMDITPSKERYMEMLAIIASESLKPGDSGWAKKQLQLIKKEIEPHCCSLCEGFSVNYDDIDEDCEDFEEAGHCGECDGAANGAHDYHKWIHEGQFDEIMETCKRCGHNPHE